MTSFFRNYNPIIFQSRIFNLTAVLVFSSIFTTFNFCDAGSSQEFKLRKGLKLSFYDTEPDSLDIPTFDAYDPSLAPSPNTVPTQYPYGAYSQISAPPANPPESAHIAPIGPQYGSSKPKFPSHSLRPALAPSLSPEFAVWCVARPTVPEPILQRAMDYACGTGAECGPIRLNGPCFMPNNLMAHASYAFNSYWQRTKIQGGTCEFGGIAMLITVDPSFRGCHFLYN